MPLHTSESEIGDTLTVCDLAAWSTPAVRGRSEKQDAVAAREVNCVRDTALAQSAAFQANVLKSRFLASVSHDLRQPLQTLRMLTSALRVPLSDDERNAALHQVDCAVTVMSELVNAVLNVSKLESGTVEPVIGCFALADLFENIRAQLAAAAECKELIIEVRATELQVRTDQVLLREILQNLVANAIRYTDRGRITLYAVAHQDGIAEVTVEDTGIGIPSTSLHSIFDDFVQVPRPTDAARGGVGLGLGTVRRIAQLLKLPVRVNSTVGIGSRFTVEVSTAGPSERPKPVSPRRSSAHTGPVARAVVFVDDDDAVRSATVLYLEKIGGYRVNAAASISELEQMLARLELPPAIIVSDYQLGDNMFGTDAIRLVRAKYGAAVPAIMMTGDTSAIVEEVIAMSATALLNKPVDVEVLTLLMADMIKAVGP